MKRLLIIPILIFTISCVPKPNNTVVITPKEDFALPQKWTETLTASNTLSPIPSKTQTPSITLTITNSPIPISNADMTKTIKKELEIRLKSDKTDGFYLVNIDIAPGVWRSNGSGNSCYWATTTKTGKIITNHYGMAGGTAYISENAYQVEFDSCGIWTYLSEK
jgi:hypothetical protein